MMRTCFVPFLQIIFLYFTLNFNILFHKIKCIPIQKSDMLKYIQRKSGYCIEAKCLCQNGCIEFGFLSTVWMVLKNISFL